MQLLHPQAHCLETPFRGDDGGAAPKPMELFRQLLEDAADLNGFVVPGNGAVLLGAVKLGQVQGLTCIEAVIFNMDGHIALVGVVFQILFGGVEGVAAKVMLLYPDIRGVDQHGGTGIQGGSIDGAFLKKLGQGIEILSGGIDGDDGGPIGLALETIGLLEIQIFLPLPVPVVLIPLLILTQGVHGDGKGLVIQHAKLGVHGVELGIAGGLGQLHIDGKLPIQLDIIHMVQSLDLPDALGTHWVPGVGFHIQTH